MKREQVQNAVKAIELRIASNSPLHTELQALRVLADAAHFSSDAAQMLIEKIMRQSPKKLRGVLYNMLVLRPERTAAWEQHKRQKQQPAQAAVTNIGAPYQGGVPGLGKR